MLVSFACPSTTQRLRSEWRVSRIPKDDKFNIPRSANHKITSEVNYGRKKRQIPVIPQPSPAIKSLNDNSANTSAATTMTVISTTVLSNNDKVISILDASAASISCSFCATSKPHEINITSVEPALKLSEQAESYSLQDNLILASLTGEVSVASTGNILVHISSDVSPKTLLGIQSLQTFSLNIRSRTPRVLSTDFPASISRRLGNLHVLGSQMSSLHSTEHKHDIRTVIPEATERTLIQSSISRLEKDNLRITPLQRSLSDNMTHDPTSPSVAKMTSEIVGDSIQTVKFASKNTPLYRTVAPSDSLNDTMITSGLNNTHKTNGNINNSSAVSQTLLNTLVNTTASKFSKLSISTKSREGGIFSSKTSDSIQQFSSRGAEILTNYDLSTLPAKDIHDIVALGSLYQSVQPSFTAPAERHTSLVHTPQLHGSVWTETNVQKVTNLVAAKLTSNTIDVPKATMDVPKFQATGKDTKRIYKLKFHILCRLNSLKVLLQIIRIIRMTYRI